MGYYELRKSKKDTSQPWYFVLIAGNHEIIATSEMYASKQGAQRGIESVRQNAPTFAVNDKT